MKPTATQIEPLVLELIYRLGIDRIEATNRVNRIFEYSPEIEKITQNPTERMVFIDMISTTPSDVPVDISLTGLFNYIKQSNK